MLKPKSQTIISTIIFSLPLLYLAVLLSGVNFLPNSAYATPVTTDLSFTSAPVLSLSNSAPTLSIQATNPDQFYTASTTLTASTNNETGYTLTMSNASTTTTDLLNPDYAETTIPSIDGDITIDGTASNFPTKHWGYSIETSIYKPIPTHSAADQIGYSDTATSGNASTVSFGVKSGSGLAAGIYSSTVTFSLTANPEKPKDITKLTSMQDLANHPEYCSATEVGVSTTLPDERDPSGKQYKIKKLADGNCWMVDNMKIADLLIEPTKSNVPSGTSFTLPAAFTGSTSVGGPTWDIQEKTARVIDATGAAASNGYLYNWYTATAGAKGSSGEDLMTASSGEAAGDICPKGWRLPDNEGSKSFYNLYNIEYPTASGQHPYQSTANMRKSDGIYPGFVFTGYYFYNSGLVGYTGNGYYWSRTVYNAAYSYRLDLNSSGDDPQNYNGKGSGFAVRCVSAY